MSNGIATRQNEESNIARLAAQRQLYREVNCIETISVVLTVVIPIILTFLQDIAGKGKTTACIISLIMIGLSFFFENMQKERRVLAATIQQEFDINVYAMEWDNKLFGIRRNLNSEIAAASKKILSDYKERESLRNWYRKEVDTLPLEEGISACQKENFSWDAGLRKRYRRFVTFVLAVIVLLQILISIIKAEPVQELLLRIFANSSALKWITKTLFGINEDLRRMESIERSVFSIGKKSMEELAYTQKEIFENRKVVTKIPDWFYRIFKDNDEDRERRALELK